MGLIRKIQDVFLYCMLFVDVFFSNFIEKIP